MKCDDEKLATWGVVALIAYAAIAGIFRAASRPFWYDEMCTVAIARQPGMSAIWKALGHAADSHPPTYYFIERFADLFLPNQHIAFRLPSILGFCCIIFCVFIFVRKQNGPVCALLCSALLLMSQFYDPYAVEARGYALMSACVAIALVCYQRADALRWIFLMGLSLAAADAFHYYAVFALFPFAIAEGAFWLQTRRLRLGVWVALACGMLPVIAFWPLLSELRKYYGAHFWSKPGLMGALDVYGWFLNLSPYWGIAIAGAAFVGVVAVIISERVREDSGSREKHRLQEKVLVLGLLALPLAVLAAMKMTHGGLTERYMLPAGLGIPLAAGFILPRFDRRLLTLFGVFLCFGLAAQESHFWLFHRHHLGEVVSPAQGVEELVDKAGRRNLPVVVSNALEFFPLMHYGSPALVTRLVDLVDISQAIVYSGTDSTDKQMLVLRSYTPLQVYEFHDFAAKYPEFLLYSGGGGWLDWWSARLADDGYVLRLVAVNENRRVYLVCRGDEACQEIPLAMRESGSNADGKEKASH
jgi:Dolichyl-phosphate-mannose-protein mannosyltransferase